MNEDSKWDEFLNVFAQSGVGPFQTDRPIKLPNILQPKPQEAASGAIYLPIILK